MLDQIWKKLECLRDKNKCICIPSYHHIISFESLQEKDLAFANVKGLCLGTEFCVLIKVKQITACLLLMSSTYMWTVGNTYLGMLHQICIIL